MAASSAPARRFVVYGLFDPRDGQLRYVGQTRQSIAARLRSHVCTARKDVRSHTYNWLRQLLASGLRPEIDIIEACHSVEDMEESERHHISYFGSIGCRLVNQTTGGERATGWKPTEEARRRMSTSHLGQAPHNKGKPLSAAHRASLSRAHQGRLLTSEHRQHISEGLSLAWSTGRRNRGGIETV